MERPLFLSLAVATAVLAGATFSRAGESLDAVVMAKALREASVPLDQAMKASEWQGMPISAKYEIEHNVLQLSIYTMNRNRFTEVIVDHRTGAIDSSAAIISGQDLKNAGAQGAAMSKARVSLEAAAHNAVTSNAGYRAVSALPSMEDGQPAVSVVLMKGQDVKRVTGKLD